MRAGEKVRFYYVDKSGMKKQKILLLSNAILKEEEMSNEEVKERLSFALRKEPTIALVEEGIIFAARNLLKQCADAKEIHVQRMEEKTQSGGSEAGGAMILLLVLAFIVAVICFPLLVILGMRGKLFLKGLYEKCQGDEYKKFVKIYTFVGIGLYAVVAIMIAVDKIFELQALFGPAFSVLFFGGIAYFIISLVIVKKKFLSSGESFSFAKLLKKKDSKEQTESECSTSSDDREVTQDDSKNVAISESNTTTNEEKVCEELEQIPTVEDVVISEESAITEDACLISNTADENSDSIIAGIESSLEDIDSIIADSEPLIKRSMPATTERPVIVQPVKTKVEEENTNHKSYKKTILIILIVCFALILGGVAYWFISEKLNEGAQGNSTEDSKDDVLDEQVEKININDYVGYWNIQDNREKELTIHQGTTDIVYFSLWYYGADEINNVTAHMKDNVASFSLASDGALIQGKLTFNTESITVHITNSSREFMPIEIMEFTERHTTSWVYGNNGYDEYGESTGTDIPNSDMEYEETVTPEYILPFSSDILLTEEDIAFLSEEELRIARNEIYARHGRIFKDEEMQAYFDAQPWYFGYIQPEDFSESMLSDIERANVELIQTYEP